MKRRQLTTNVLFLVILLSCSLLSNTMSVAASKSVYTASHQVTISGKKVTLSVVWVDLKDPLIRVESVLAKGSVGTTASLKDIIASASDIDGIGIAGINGTFFNAYDDLQPAGTILKDGEIEHLSTSGSLFVFDYLNQASVIQSTIQIEGSTQDQWVWPYKWYAWNINHFYKDDKAIMIFDKDYNGPKPSHDFTVITVDKGIVTSIKTGGFAIPEEGFIVLAKDENVIKTFILGKTANYRVNFLDKNKVSQNNFFDTIRTGVGAGPTILKAGVVSADPVAEGFTEAKITSNKALRSLMGVTSTGKLGMVAVPNVTMLELADVAKQLGMVDAINLDGGGSTAVYANGSYVALPGRDISNGIVIKQLYKTPVKILLNKKPVFFDVEPYIDPSSSRTMVPLRTIAEALGAVVGWDSATSSITVTRYNTVLKLKTGSSNLEINGINQTMDMEVLLRDGRTFVPVRFITDAFGGDVGWSQEFSAVTLDITTLEDLLIEADVKQELGDLEGALEVYKKVLQLNPSHLFTYKTMSSIYNQLKDLPNAIDMDKKIVAIDPLDSVTIQSLAWKLYSSNAIEEGMVYFNQYIKLKPQEGIGYYGLAQCYSSYSYQDVENAIKYFELALKYTLSDSQKTYAQKYIQEHQ